MGENARVCQFFLRGRCQRQKCEFRHPAELEKEKRPNGTDRDERLLAASIFLIVKFFGMIF